MLYPRIYLACHTDHVRASPCGETLPAGDATILAQMSGDEDSSPSRLASHLNVTRATLSEAVARLEDLGYIASQFDATDERRKLLQLTEKGKGAISRSSVLDYEKLKSRIERLSTAERQKVIEGLSLLAGV